jgi:hypothetical protein
MDNNIIKNNTSVNKIKIFTKMKGTSFGYYGYFLISFFHFSSGCGALRRNLNTPIAPAKPPHHIRYPTWKLLLSNLEL